MVVSRGGDLGALPARHRRATPSSVLLRHLDEPTPDRQAALLRANLPAGADEPAFGTVVTFSGTGCASTPSLATRRDGNT